jgi:choline dehydrogenase-like flavoprotein
LILDFTNAETPESFACDVCLVGAGAAGIVLAQTLTESGFSVVLVESGGETPLAEDQKLNAGFTDGHFAGLEKGRARSFGGATKLWYGQCIRLEEIDYAARAWVPHSGWPISSADLAPYFERAEAYFEIAGQAYDAAIYRRLGLPVPEFDSQLCKSHFTIYTPLVDLASIYRASLARNERLTVLLRANVLEVTTNATATQATGVSIRTLHSRQGTIQANTVVLCGGGIENARLLLLSKSVNPAGLGNDRDLVGRFFQDHPNGQTATLTTEQVPLVTELFSLLYEPPLRFFPKLAMSAALQEKQEVLNCNAHFVFEYGEDSGIEAGKTIYRHLRRGERPPELGKNLRSMVSDLPETLRAAKRFLIDHKSPLGKPKRIRFQCYLEQTPDAANRVTLAEEFDALGQPKSHIAWKLGDLERRTLQAMTDAVAREFARLGLGRLQPDAWLNDPDADWQSKLDQAAHLIGTTRMASTADRGVVDTNCGVFGVSGLYVAGSSVFPTSGYANPTLAIVAQAFRLADHLTSTVVRA